MKKVCKKIGKIIIKILIVMVVVIILFLVIRFGIRQIRKYQAETTNEVSKIVTYNLNGQEQSVLIEGKSVDLPILVLLHGGPCFPAPFNEGCRGMFPELTDHYLTVYWDQLGCGLNRNTYTDGSHIPADLEISDYVLMLKDLLVDLRNDYPGQKVYLFANSWGTYLSASIASEYPELVDEVLVYGQLRGDMFQTEDVFDGILDYCNVDEDKAFLLECKEKDKLTNEEIFRVEGMIFKYTDGSIYTGKTGEKQSNGKLIYIVLQYLFSPDYSLRDVKGVFTDSGEAENLAIALIHLDLTQTLENIKVPYKIMQGEKDLQTSRYRIEDFMKQTNNKNITYMSVPNCGHFPTSKCFDMIINEIQQMDIK